jgi:hypothetical protein
MRDHTDCKRRGKLEDMEYWSGPHSSAVTSGTRKDVSLLSMILQSFINF